MTLIKVPKKHAVRIECDGPEVALILDNRLVLKAHHSAIETVAKRLLEGCARARLLTRPAKVS